MFAPDVNDTIDKLTGAYAGVVGIDNFAMSCQSIRIVPLPAPPDWLAPVRTELNQLDQAADAWQQARAQVWAPVLLAFQNYFSTFSGVVNMLKPATSNDAAFWVDILERTLLPAVNQSLAGTKAAQVQLDQRMAAFSLVLPQLDKSIGAGWAALSGEEQKMLTLTDQVGQLTQTVQALGSKITSDAIASDKGVAQSAVSMLYTAGAAGAEAAVPIVGLVVAVFTIGKSFYDLVQDDNALIALLDQINGIKAQLSDEALGLALTKSTLQTLYGIEAQYLALRDAIPGLVDLWTTQQSKVQNAIAALRAGAQPAQYLDLATLPIAQAAWQTVDTFVGQVSKVDVQVGVPVTIDIARAQVRPTLASPQP